jgi:hypothetical protein
MQSQASRWGLVLAAVLFLSAGALQASRLEEPVAAREQHRPLPVLMYPGDDLPPHQVAPGGHRLIWLP